MHLRTFRPTKRREKQSCRFRRKWNIYNRNEEKEIRCDELVDDQSVRFSTISSIYRNCDLYVYIQFVVYPLSLAGRQNVLFLPILREKFSARACHMYKMQEISGWSIEDDVHPYSQYLSLTLEWLAGCWGTCTIELHLRSLVVVKVFCQY